MFSSADLAPDALANLRKLEAPSRDGSSQKEVLITWDIENAKVPIGVPVEEVVRAISNAFQFVQRRKRSSFWCSLSRPSLAALGNASGWDGVDHLCRQTKVLLAAGGEKSGSADVKLCEEIDTFVSRQAQDGRAAASVLVVITGDDDFTKSISNAMNAGMDVEVLHPPGQTSAKLLGTISGCPHVWHHDWLEFLEYWLRTHNKCPNMPDRLELPRSAGNTRPAQGQGGPNQPLYKPKPRTDYQNQPQRSQQHQQPRDTRSAAASSAANHNSQRRREEPSPPPAHTAPSARTATAGAAPPGREVSAGSCKHAMVASLRLASLSLVQACPEPALALSALCDWLLRHRQEGSAWYQSLNAMAAEAGCELALSPDLHAQGQILITCAVRSDDTTDAIRAARRIRDRVRSSIIERLSTIPDRLASRDSAAANRDSTGRGPTCAAPPPSAAASWPPALLGRLCTACPTSRLTPSQLQSFLAERGVSVGDKTGGAQLLRLTNLVLLAEAELGQDPSTWPRGAGCGGGGGSSGELPGMLLPVEGSDGQPHGLSTVAEKAAVREYMLRSLSSRQLLAQVKARGLVLEGNEKGDLVEALCEALPLWAVVETGG